MWSGLIQIRLLPVRKLNSKDDNPKVTLAPGADCVPLPRVRCTPLKCASKRLTVAFVWTVPERHYSVGKEKRVDERGVLDAQL